jgi:SAM-dependent methyltransferase
MKEAPRAEAQPLHPKDPKRRFTSRVGDYVRYRPGYPASLAAMLVSEAGLGPADGTRTTRTSPPGDGGAVVDVGSGTGIMTRAILRALPAPPPPAASPVLPAEAAGAPDAPGVRVFAVEPNPAMRAAAEEASANEPRFFSVEGSAEATGLPGAAADLIVVAQAFHWFDPLKTRAEFARIAKEGALVALVWNERKDTPLNRDYEAMLEELAPDYAAVRAPQRENEGAIRAFFAGASASAAVTRTVFANEQRLDREGLRGRLLSSSYCPPAGEPGHLEIMNRLDTIFRAHEKNGEVTLPYDTVAWTGRLAS